MEHLHVHFMNATSQTGCKWTYLQPGLSTLSVVWSFKNNPVLFILDGHPLTQNLELRDLARENGIVLRCLPPHCSHRMQPLDVSFMKPLSTYYDQELEKWLRNNPGRIVTTFQITELFGHAYVKAATSQTAANGFRKTGTFPTNIYIYIYSCHTNLLQLIQQTFQLTIQNRKSIF